MADKTLNDVVDSLRSLENTVKDPPKSLKEIEQQQENTVREDEAHSIQVEILNTLQSGFGAATTEDKKKGGLIAGLLGGIGAGLGGIGKAVANIGKGFGIGLAALGAGIAGFVLALGIASKILEYMNPDTTVLTTIITNFFDAFSEKNAIKMGVLATIAGLLAAFDVKPLRFAGMMTAMGAGIAGFAGGILIGEAVAGYALTIMGGLDGSALTNLLNNFFGAMTPASAAGVGVLVTISGLLAAFDVDGLDMAIMMTGIGAGVAGFAGGILIGTALTKYGLAAMGALDTTSLTNLLHGFFAAITPEIAIGIGSIVTLAAIGTKLGITDIKGVLGISLGMTAIGAGIAGFSLGILLADGLAKLGEMATLDGSSLATLMTNFMGAFDGIGLTALGALITAGAVLGTSGVGAVGVVIGMTAIGAGIAAFMGALTLADWIASLGGDNVGGSLATLLTNIGKAIGGFLGGMAGETMKQMESIDGAKLAQIGKGIFNLGTGMLAFAGGKLADTGANIIGSITSFFGGDDKGPLAQFAEISKDTSINANRLSELGLGISNLAKGLSAFAAVNSTGLAANAISTTMLAQIPGGGALKNALNLQNGSADNAMAKTGGGDTFNTFNTTDNSVSSQTTTAVNAPESAKPAEGSFVGILMNLNPFD